MKPILLSLLVCLVSCSEQKVTAHNAAPDAFITSHTSGTVVAETDVALAKWIDSLEGGDAERGEHGLDEPPADDGRCAAERSV